MTNRESALAILHYQPCGRLPVVHFGYWPETLEKWRREGHLTEDEIRGWGDGNAQDRALAAKIGFDFDWHPVFGCHTGLLPAFQTKVLEELPDGSRKVLNGDGAVVLQKDGVTSIPAEVDHILKDRASWEQHFLPRLQFLEDRVDTVFLAGLPEPSVRQNPIGIHCGSLFGSIRNWLGLEGSCYLLADDEELFTEIIDTVGDLCYRCVELALSTGARFDFAHFWEDICFKNGPLISPRVFRQKVGPHYRCITELLLRHGVDIVSVDCDGMIDSLIPTWLENGVNTMFPIEVGTWNASIQPWRDLYGRDLRGVGGMNKTVFSRDRAAVDAEVQRLKPLVELGGFIPCPDHRIAPDAVWDNVLYYCERMRQEFG